MGTHRLGWGRALAALAVLKLLAACSDKQAVQPTPAAAGLEPLPTPVGTPEREEWYRVLIQSQPAGWVHRVEHSLPSPQGPLRLTRWQERLWLRRQGEVARLDQTLTTLEGPDGTLLRLRQEKAGLSGPEVLEAGRVGSQMVTVRGPEIRRVPFETGAVGPLRPLEVVRPAGAADGTRSVPFRSYSTLLGGYTDNQAFFSAAPGGGWAVVHECADLPGVRHQARLAVDGRLEELRSPIASLVVEVHRVPTRPDEGAGADLDQAMRLPVDRPIPNPERLTSARYRLQGLSDPAAREGLSGPGQHLLPAEGDATIEVRRLAPAAPRTFPPQAPPELARYLRSTALENADDPEIRERARSLTAGVPDAGEALRRLRRWVREEIGSSMGVVSAGASDVLRERTGDCTEKATLLCALARASGIPARTVGGLLYHQGAFTRHMWVEAWIGEWRAVDPSVPDEIPSAARIRHSEMDSGLGEGGRLPPSQTLPCRAVLVLDLQWAP